MAGEGRSDIVTPKSSQNTQKAHQKSAMIRGYGRGTLHTGVVIDPLPWLCLTVLIVRLTNKHFQGCLFDILGS